MKKKGGFTLIELLVSASILSVVMLGAYSAFRGGVLSYKKIDSALSVYQAAISLLNRMELDLKNSFAYRQQDSKFKGDNRNMDFFSVLDIFDEELAAKTVLCRLKYSWQERKFKRAVAVNQEALKEEGAPEGEEAPSAIKEVKFQYATGGKEGRWQELWPKENDGAQKATLPAAVKIELTLKADSGESVTFIKTVYLPLD
jgi:prepilin-type N-terminal cleavage/methylation domain-containing protein